MRSFIYHVISRLWNEKKNFPTTYLYLLLFPLLFSFLLILFNPVIQPSHAMGFHGNSQSRRIGESRIIATYKSEIKRRLYLPRKVQEYVSTLHWTDCSPGSTQQPFRNKSYWGNEQCSRIFPCEREGKRESSIYHEHRMLRRASYLKLILCSLSSIEFYLFIFLFNAT